MHRCQDAKRHGLLRFELFKKIDKFLSLNFRNFLISPLEGEKKFLSELNELSNKGRLGILAQREAGFEPSPAFVMLTGVRKRLLPLTKREGCDSVISNNFSETVFSHFTSHFSLKRTAFTLAEVLITLGIIGVVSAITLPALVQNYQKYVTVNRLKKEYSVISNAFVTSQEENGEMNTWRMGDLGSVNDGDNVLIPFYQNYIVKYLDVVDDCGFSCIKQREVKRYRLNGMSWTWYNHCWYVIYLKDGTVVCFMADNNSVVWSTVRIYVDINGDRGPNVSGKDIFTILLATNGDSALRLSGIDAIRNSKSRATLLGNCRECCSKESTGNYAGDFCAGLIQYDGWKISKDYPW